MACTLVSRLWSISQLIFGHWFKNYFLSRHEECAGVHKASTISSYVRRSYVHFRYPRSKFGKFCSLTCISHGMYYSEVYIYQWPAAPTGNYAALNLISKALNFVLLFYVISCFTSTDYRRTKTLRSGKFIEDRSVPAPLKTPAVVQTHSGGNLQALSWKNSGNRRWNMKKTIILQLGSFTSGSNRCSITLWM